MVPELLKGKRSKSTIGDDGENEVDEMEENEDGSYIEDRSIEVREPDESNVTGDIGVKRDMETEMKHPLINGDIEEIEDKETDIKPPHINKDIGVIEDKETDIKPPLINNGDIGVIEDMETDIKPPLIAPSPPSYMGDVQPSSHGAIPRSMVTRPSVIRFQPWDQREAGTSYDGLYDNLYQREAGTSGSGEGCREAREQGGMRVSGE